MRIWKASSRSAPALETTPARLRSLRFEKDEQQNSSSVVCSPGTPGTTTGFSPMRHDPSSLSRALNTPSTRSAPGNLFTFTITADSHLDDRTDSDLYPRRHQRLAGHPDFHIDLGDTFMTEKHVTRERAAAVPCPASLLRAPGHSVPFYLVSGNHDGEGNRWLDGTPDDLARRVNTMRKRYFPNLSGRLLHGRLHQGQVRWPIAGLLCVGMG